MIVVFVVDTSPSMGKPLMEKTGSTDGSRNTSGLNRLDLAKMAVESLSKGLSRRIMEHNNQLQQEDPVMQKSLHNLGLGFCTPDHFLLLSTGRQYRQVSTTASCAAGGRLLVGYGGDSDETGGHEGKAEVAPHRRNHAVFDRELKHLQPTVWQSPSTSAAGASAGPNLPFPEDGGGATGLNISLSTGLQLLSRYRLNNRSTENFGLGRLPSPAILSPSGGGVASQALQSAVLILVTDGECLRKPPNEGGGSLELKRGNIPLQEFYREPFRWDQRVFVLGVGAGRGIASSSQYLPHSLRALCEVTGGGHMLLQSSSMLPNVTDSLLKRIAPPRPSVMPISDPLFFTKTPAPVTKTPEGTFVNAGPVCCFQALEAGPNGEAAPTNRAMLLYVPALKQSSEAALSTELADSQTIFHPPVWCIPESYFPSKSLDTLPPRLAQPLLTFSWNFSVVGSATFDPSVVLKDLHRLDQLVLGNRRDRANVSGASPAQGKLLHRDVYICNWLSQDGKGAPPKTPHGSEYFPVGVRGGGRPLSEGDEHFLSIGILHLPENSVSLTTQTAGKQFSTLTLLPPEPHILLPLLIKAAEAEHRAIKKAAEFKELPERSGQTTGITQKQGLIAGPKNVHLDEHWRSEFRAYLFRVPIYYHNALKRSLRHVLPASAHSLLSLEGIETIAAQCFSKNCLQRIRNAEQQAREINERLERQEAELRRHGINPTESKFRKHHGDDSRGLPIVGYGQYDPRTSTASYLAALRNMPAPWRVGAPSRRYLKGDDAANTAEIGSQTEKSEVASITSGKDEANLSVLDILGDLPANCLMPYYESRRRWLFGGSGLTTRGLQVEGVNNDGSNTHRHRANHCIDDESLLSIAGIGVATLNQTTTVKMGDFRERLLWSRAPVVGFGSNDAAGVAATTAADGSAKWSVDDDSFPTAFFNPVTGEFSDSVETRVRSRLMVNFGNPYKDKRGDSLVPEKFLSQLPALQQKNGDSVDHGQRTPPGSPPHDAFAALEGEGEAVFAEQSAVRKSTSRHMRPEHVDQVAKGVPENTAGDKRTREDEAGDEALRDRKDPPTKKAKAYEAPTKPPPPPPPKGIPGKQPPPPRPKPPPPPSSERHISGNETASVDISLSNPVSKPAAVQWQGFSASKDGNKPSSAQTDLQNPEDKPKLELPSGWMCVWSKSQKRWYFFDTKSNRSVWEWPPPGGVT